MYINLSLLFKCFVCLVFIVKYTESNSYTPTMNPNELNIHVLKNQRLEIKCTSTRKMNFFFVPNKLGFLNSSNGDKNQIKLSDKNYMITLEKNKTIAGDAGWYGCGHDKEEDADVRWAYVYIISNDTDETSDLYRRKEKFQGVSYIQMNKNQTLEITCNGKEKMMMVLLLAPWKYCILSFKNNSKKKKNETQTSMFEEVEKFHSYERFCKCSHYGKDSRNLSMSDIHEDEVNGNHTIVFRKNHTVHGDTGWYGCAHLNQRRYLFKLTYVYVKPTRNYFVESGSLKAFKAKVNQSLTLPCRPTSPKYQVILYANDTQIDESKNVIFNRSLGFTLKNLQLKDSGYYKCKITSDGITEESDFDVTITKSYSFLPKMIPDVSYIQVNENQPLEMTCTSVRKIEFFCSGWASIKFLRLRKNEKSINERNGIHTIKILRKNVTLSNTGWCGCGHVENVNDTIVMSFTRWIYIYVKKQPKIEYLINVKNYYKEGEIVKVNSFFKSLPTSSIITWTFKSDLDSMIQTLTDTVEFFNSTTLSITSSVMFTILSNGTLTCTVYNDLGNDSAIIPLIINNHPPKIGIVSPNKKVAIGDALELICDVPDIYKLTDDIEWLESDGNPKIRPYDSRIKKNQTKTKYSYRSILTIDPVVKSDQQMYYCTTKKSMYPSIMYDYMLNVYELKNPNIVRTNMIGTKYYYENETESMFLNCYVEGIPEPEITWQKDNVLINATDNFCGYEFFNNTQVLKIGNLYEKCDGNYSCKAKNRVDETKTFQQIMKQKEYRKDKVLSTFLITAIISTFIIAIIFVIYLFLKMRKERKLRKQLMKAGLMHFEEGDIKSLNPELSINNQADLLPYDKKWEFPRDKLQLGKQLGCGQFGVVIKAEAQGINNDDDSKTTVAVKMVKKFKEVTHVRALAGELKIMAHLGKHLNVVNLLGACTKNIATGKLLVIVEYCRFGNLRDYLMKHRSKFINQIDPATGKINFSISFEIVNQLANVGSNKKIKYTSLSFSRSISADSLSHQDSVELSNDIALNNKLTQQPADSQSNYPGNFTKEQNLKSICTQDLLEWAFQVAQGMEYLGERKILHGDLAARNILLAEDNIVKICDFGLARNMYNDKLYTKLSDDPLPLNWMAVESMRDRIFSTQSDVWSFGIVLWEFFSLAETPYPEMEAKEVYFKVLDGYRMDKPKYATNDIYKIMYKCWLEKPTFRPTFTDLISNIGDLLDSRVKTHYSHLYAPYFDMNKKLHDGKDNDLLTMTSAPNYVLLSLPKINNVNEPINDTNTELLNGCSGMSSTNNNYYSSTSTIKNEFELTESLSIVK